MGHIEGFLSKQMRLRSAIKSFRSIIILLFGGLVVGFLMLLLLLLFFFQRREVGRYVLGVIVLNHG